MKNQALFSSKDKSKKLKCRLLQFLFGALRVNMFSDLKFTLLCDEAELADCFQNQQRNFCRSDCFLACNLADL